MDTEHQHPESSPGFVWHPVYAGKSFDEVETELASQIGADQRQHSLAMDGAEESEHDALASVVELERRWGQYDFDWADQDAGALASRILAFEQERERRREMISWNDYRMQSDVTQDHASEITSPTELSIRGKGFALVALIAVIVVILIVLALL